MKKYIYNLFTGSYDCPVLDSVQVFHFYLGQVFVTCSTFKYPSYTCVFVKEVESDEP